LLRPDDEIRVAITVEVAGRGDADPEPSRASGRGGNGEIRRIVDPGPAEVEPRLPKTLEIRVAERSDEEVIVAISVDVAAPGHRAAELVADVRPRGLDEGPGRDGRSSNHARPGEKGDADENGDRECRGTPPEWQANEAGAMHGAPPTPRDG